MNCSTKSEAMESSCDARINESNKSESSKNNIRTCLLKFKNWVTCQDVITHSDSDDEDGRIADNLKYKYSVADTRDNVQKVCKKDEGHSELHEAARRGDTESVRRLLMSSANVDALDKGHKTPLHYASQNGHVDVVNLLLSKNPSVNSGNTFGQTSLHPAAKQGHAGVAENMIYNGANVNACNNGKMTALHLACQNGHTSIVKILLDNHATVDVIKQSVKAPFYIAAVNGHADVTDLLLRRGVCDFVLTHDFKETPLHAAVKEGYTQVVEVILNHCRTLADKLIEDRLKLQEKSKNLIETREMKTIQLSKFRGRRVSAEIVLTEKSEPLEIWRNSDKRTALDLAILSTQPKLVKLLLNADQCTYSEDHLRTGFSCLIETIIGYNNKVCRKSKGTMNARRDIGQNSLTCDNIKQIAHSVIGSCKFNPNHKSDIMKTPLHEIMIPIILSDDMIRPSYLIQLLLEKGSDFNMKNSFGETPLIIASENGNCQVVQILFDWEKTSGMKLNLDARDRYGETALIKAAGRHDISIVQLLLSHKSSVNLHDYNGFTALHAAIHQSNAKWYDLHFFCEGLRKEKCDDDEYREISCRDKLIWGDKTVDPYTVIDRIQYYLGLYDDATGLKEKVVKLLLDNDDTNVNAIDLRGNTPLDLSVKFSNRINLATLKALKNRGAVRKSQEPDDETPLEVTRIDENGRNPLHRLIISRMSIEEDMEAEKEQETEQFDLMFYAILLRSDHFIESASAKDNKGRTPLHYAVMQSSNFGDLGQHLVMLLLKLGSNPNAADIYGKTPLHYAELGDQYKLLVWRGANENAKDYFGDSPYEIRRLKESVTISEFNAGDKRLKKQPTYAYMDAAQVFDTNHVSELSKCKEVEMIRIYHQSPGPEESSEEAIWRMWTQNEFIRINRRLSNIKPSVKRFMERLADGIKEKDWRFECQPSLVGSAEEETKVFTADFDFNFKLNKFSQICDPFPQPLGPKGYFELRRKASENVKSRSDEMLDIFFNLDKCLLTDEVNSRFQIIVDEVFSEPAFWKDEHILYWNVVDKKQNLYENPFGLCKTLLLRMNHPIGDGEGGFIVVNISIDIVACVHVEDWWPEYPLSTVKACGSTFVFDEPRYGPSRSRNARFRTSETFARISFAPLESRIVKESSSLIKAAYMVCKMILRCNYHAKATYQLKTCLLFCMEALNVQHGSETSKGEEITPEQLAFWVERIMFCFLEFSRHGGFPCYFMPSFYVRVMLGHEGQLNFQRRKEDEWNVSAEAMSPFMYSAAYDLYFDVCPADTSIDIPIIQQEQRLNDKSFDQNYEPKYEQFDRKELIRKLSSRIFHPRI